MCPGSGTMAWRARPSCWPSDANPASTGALESGGGETAATELGRRNHVSTPPPWSCIYPVVLVVYLRRCRDRAPTSPLWSCIYTAIVIYAAAVAVHCPAVL